MQKMAGLPYSEIAFSKAGEHAPLGTLFPAGTTDLIFISHGWKNDEDNARKLYEGIVRNMLAAGGATSGRVFAVIGVRWPAFRFNPDLTLLPDGPPGGDGGAAGLGDTDFSPAELAAYVKDVAAVLGIKDIGAFVAAAEDARGGGGAANRYIERLRAEVSPVGADTADVREEHDKLFTEPGKELVKRLGKPPVLPQQQRGGGGPGAAAGFTDDVLQTLKRWRTGGRAGVASVLNQFTYYEMKARAGIVGHALAKIVDDVPSGVRVHLVGHSFGARLVTAAAAGMTKRGLSSLTLLQGAFSHNGLGQAIGGSVKNGAFRAVIETRRVAGPIAITHTRNDTAVGFFYAVASTISGEVAAGLGITNLVGGPEDLHGGIGANGALAMKDTETATWIAQKRKLLSLTRGKVNNVLSDAIIKDHNDVANAEAARVVWAAIAAAP